jgi:type I restriction enzyme S subunit
MSGLRVAVLAELLVEARSGFACGEDPSDGVFQFRMNNITMDGQLDLSKKRRVPRNTRKLESFLAEPGDVLFNATNSPDLVGKAAYFPGLDEPAVFSNHFLRLRPNPERLEGRFLARWLNLQFQRGVFKGMCHQWVNQATVNRDSLLALRVPIPGILEQRRIAEVLDRAEALRAKRRAALAHVDTLTQAIFLDMFGDPATNPKGWPAVPLRDIVDEFRYGTSTKSGPQGKPALRIPNIIGGHINVSDLKAVPVGPAEFERLKLVDGDVLFVRTNGNPDFVGRCAVFERSAVASSGFPSDAFVFASYLIRARLHTNRISPAFLREFMLGPEGRRRLRARSKTSAGQFNINTESLGLISVPVPSQNLQTEFARRIAVVEQLKGPHRASLAELDALFASLQHRAFRGEL